MADVTPLDMLRILRWLVGVPVVLFGAYVVGFNWATIPWNTRLAAKGVDRHVSTVPIAGPLALTLGLACLFWRFSPHYLWVWLMDWPTATLPVVLVWLCWQPKQGSPTKPQDRDLQ